VPRSSHYEEDKGRKWKKKIGKKIEEIFMK
jgi:hypothetical protein